MFAAVLEMSKKGMGRIMPPSMMKIFPGWSQTKTRPLASGAAAMQVGE
jgi:hypothetical protein